MVFAGIGYYTNKSLHFLPNLNKPDKSLHFLPNLNKPEILWQSKKIDDLELYAFSYANGLIYVYNTNPASEEASPIVVIDSKTGEEKWRIPMRNYISSDNPFIVQGDTIFFADTKFYSKQVFLAIDNKTGEERLRIDAGSSPYPSIGEFLVAENSVFLSNSSYLYSINAQTGQEQWRTTQPLTKGLVAPPILSNNSLFLLTTEGLYALDSKTGQEKWKYKIIQSGFLFTPPVIAKNTVYFKINNKDLFAVDATTGQENWRFSLLQDIVAGPVVENDTVYVKTESKIYAVDGETGKEIWVLDIGDRAPWDLAINNGVLYFKKSYGFCFDVCTKFSLHAYDVKTRKEKWSFDPSGMVRGLVVNKDEGVVYVFSPVPGFDLYGHLYGLR